MCRDVGYVQFLERDSENLKIDVKGQIEKYEVLKIVEFTSDRKRMSVIVKREHDGKVFNFIKGADIAIIPRLSKSEGEEDTITLMDSFASKGLRTLMFGMKELSPLTSKKSLDEMPTEEFENDVTLLGITGLEDLLQDEVK
jgi:magnesium-transporting ATPase (P-type)